MLNTVHRQVKKLSVQSVPKKFRPTLKNYSFSNFWSRVINMAWSRSRIYLRIWQRWIWFIFLK